MRPRPQTRNVKRKIGLGVKLSGRVLVRSWVLNPRSSEQNMKNKKSQVKTDLDKGTGTIHRAKEELVNDVETSGRPCKRVDSHTQNQPKMIDKTKTQGQNFPSPSKI